MVEIINWKTWMPVAGVIIAVVLLGVISTESASIMGKSDKFSSAISSLRVAQTLELVSTTPSMEGSIDLYQEPERIRVSQEVINVSLGSSYTSVIPRVGQSFASKSLEGTKELCVTNDGTIQVGEKCSFESCDVGRCRVLNGVGYFCRSGAWTTEGFDENCRVTGGGTG